MIGSCTSHLEMLQILPCEMLKGNTMQQNSSITKRNQNMRGKQLVRYYIGRSQKQSIVNEINLPEKTVTSTSELVNVFNDYFTDVSPKLAEKIEYGHNCSFRDFILNMNQLRDLFSNL